MDTISIIKEFTISTINDIITVINNIKINLDKYFVSSLVDDSHLIESKFYNRIFNITDNPITLSNYNDYKY